MAEEAWAVVALILVPAVVVAAGLAPPGSWLGRALRSLGGEDVE